MSNDIPSPSQLVPKRNAQHERDLARARQEGYNEGLTKGREEIVDWLQNCYINDPGRPDRDSEKGKAILELARDASLHFRSLIKGKTKGRRR